MSENESDHEEASFDPFASDNSGDERDDSSSDDEDGAAERDCLSNENFLNFVQMAKYTVYIMRYNIQYLDIVYKQDRIFEEVKEEDWKLFENLETFHDKPFRPEKLSPSIGYRRDGITEEMINNPALLYRFVYGSSSTGLLEFLSLQ